MPGVPEDLSARLSAALQKSTAKSSSVAAQPGAIPPGMEMSGVFKLPTAAPPQAAVTDEFSGRLSSALSVARGDSPSRLEAADAGIAEAAEVSGPVGQGDYVVRHGDCISSIGLDFGFYPETIWNFAANSELKSVRKNMNVLLPGDRVTIPDKTRKDEPIAAEQRHRFKRKGCPEKLQVRFENEKKEPYVSMAYTVTIDGVTKDGLTDGDGAVRIPIPPNARRAKIVFPELDEIYEFDLGALEPIDTIKGVQARLSNLGFLRAAASGHLDKKTLAAIRSYQIAYGLPAPTGQPDEATRQHILQKHGS